MCIRDSSISDVDSLGAAIGVYCAARVLGKKAQIVLNEMCIRDRCGLIRDAEVFPESGCVGKAPAVVVDSQIR